MTETKHGEDAVTPETNETVMWMQNVAAEQDASSSASSSSSGAEGAAIKAWRESERLSFKDILARADPSAEFKWRRHLEEGMEAKNHPVEKEGMGGGR